ncbi:NADPH2:quinone reductase [Amycolatopsis marina]|uniref:NADPH2:quinone reductase n=1 Tax=Amycolatopsis marina TaxID=490629 RepID=A0A1I0VBU0_9PSEU|nr:zinc-binding dehydrogenase [Amycolatopsis marina]SFA73805.1 NADPH2:quinone reductase [Amycolatopsis marina]
MRAIRQHEFGPADRLRQEEVQDPAPAEGQVRIRVAVAGVHLLDTTIRSGTNGGPFPLPELPMTPGREVAGVVDELGAGVDGYWLGKRVVAHLGPASGGYAELAVVAASSLHELSAEVDFAAAVAMIGTGRTAVGILHVAALSADDVVLVPAAAGGIGTLLVQEARRVGAMVIGLARGQDKVELIRSLGADAAVDYSGEDWSATVRSTLDGREPSVVLDGVGGTVGQTALEMLGIGGRVITFGWSSGEPIRITTEILYSRGLTAAVAVGPRLLRRPGGLRGLETESLAALAQGRLSPVVHEPFPLAEAASAHAALEGRATTGKVVLTPNR